VEPRIFKDTIALPYQWALGPVNTRFFQEFRERRIFGTRCPRCERVLVPARAFCARCFVPLDEWVQVRDEGTIKTWTYVAYSYLGQPMQPPYVSALIQLDGADTAIAHVVAGFDLSNLDEVRARIKVGTRVRAVWREETEGTILDIKYFEPV